MQSTGGRDSRELLQSDYRSVFEMMRPNLRRRFAPYFLLFEVRTLHLLLRAAAGNDRSHLQRHCQTSLLDQQLLKKILKCEQLDELLVLLEDWFGFLGVDSFIALYNRGGGRAVEGALTDGLLNRLVRERKSKVVAAFVDDQIDLHNLLTAGRALRWELDDVSLLDGEGEISRQLTDATTRSGRQGLQQVVSRYGGAGVDLALLESEMLARFSRRIALAGRDPLGDGLIIDYLWRRYLTFRSSGLQFWAGEEITAWEGVA
jgi:vacuolar-type H+-ATPase subunit C/Vma6